MAFLPENYEVPASPGQYMRLEQGPNKFRILANPVIGWEWWGVKQDGSKAVFRAPVDADTIGDFPDDIEPDRDGRLKHFWAMKVWNYDAKAVQVLSLTQKTILESIKDLNANSDWGNPLEYDITITRKGESLETQYSVQPSPKKPLDKEIEKANKETEVNLEALFVGADPFNTDATTPEEVFKEDTKEETKEDDLPF